MKTLFTISMLAAICAGACAAEDPIPEHPTYVDDVEPILRGNCFNCHGVTASPLQYRTKRWDVCELNAFSNVGPFMDVSNADFLGAKMRIPQTLAVYVLPRLGARPVMPPIPGRVLSDRQNQVLEAWAKNPVCGQRAHNQKPTAAWLMKPTQFVVEDGDFDQVLGTITCGAASAQILHSGANELPAGASPPCTLMISDGQDAVTASLEN